MAFASVSVEPEETECSFCRELFTEPKLLPCGHLLCRHCLVDWMKTQQEARCPLCRCAIIEEEQRALQSLEDVADGFPTDLAMEELVEAQRFLNKEHDCCVCEDVAATALCLNCGDMLCEACKEAHGNLLMTQSHIVEDLSFQTAEKVVANRQSTCEAHPDKTTKLYCPTHGASICLLCASSKHRNCPDVKDLQEKAEEARAKLAELEATLSAKGTELDRAIGQLDQHLQDTEKQMQATIAEIEKTCDRLESVAKEHRSRLRKQALKECSCVKVDPGNVGGMRQLRGKLALHKRVIERAEGMQSRHALRNMTSAMEKRVAKLDCSDTSLTASTVIIVIAPEAVSSFERRLSALGTIRVVPFDPVAAVQKRITVVFHDNHGTSIVLSNNKQTAERTDDENDNTLVVLRDPMEVNMLYEVQVDKWDRTLRCAGCHLVAGVVTQSPDDITLPGRCGSLLSAAAVCCEISKDSGTLYAKRTRVGKALSSLHEGSRVGVSLDSKDCLHLLVDGQRQGMVTRNVPQPCYALFALKESTRQVTLLPATQLPQ